MLTDCAQVFRGISKSRRRRRRRLTIIALLHFIGAGAAAAAAAATAAAANDSLCVQQFSHPSAGHLERTSFTVAHCRI